jgi:uncharacterized protein (TIGR00661 family)
MKIFYAVQATGNGHISRAATLLPYLSAYGQVDVFLSGNNYALKTELPVAYRSRGLSLQYDKQTGSVDLWKTFQKANLRKVWNEAKCLPIENYDLIINDFECITAMACRLKKIPSIQFGHQASFQSSRVPRPPKKDWIGEFVLANYAKATHYLGLHFKQYDDFVCPPIIKPSILAADPKDEGHITVYLSHVSDEIQVKIFSGLKNFKFHVFSSAVSAPYQKDNIRFFPVNQEMFNHSMIHCHGVITGAGFETPAEALYLGKKLMVFPMKGQYEQQCNAAALASYGVQVLENFDSYFPAFFNKWIYESNIQSLELTMSIEEIVEKLFSLQNKIIHMRPDDAGFRIDAAAF